MPVALTKQTLQQYSQNKEGESDLFVTNFQVESLDGLYRFIFSGEVPFEFIMNFLDQISHVFARSGSFVTFKEIVDNQSEGAKEITVDPRVLLFSLMVCDENKLMKLMTLLGLSPAYH